MPEDATAAATAGQVSPEAALIAEILAGRRDRFADLIRPFERRIYAMAWNFTHHHEAANDLAQEIFLATYRSLPTFNRSRPFLPWLMRIATNHCYKALHRRSREPILSKPVGPEPPDPLLVQVRAEWRAEVLAAFQALPDDFKLVVWLYYFFERSCRQIAEILEISEDLVKIRLFRARKLMGARLGKTDAETL
jgi:RNA polymerase sigma-70 factor (ECF subfamily)